MYCSIGNWYGKYNMSGDAAIVDAGFCCNYDDDCDYVDECTHHTDPQDCVKSYCTWNTPGPNARADAKGSCSWSPDGCSTDPRCCLNLNTTTEKPSACGRRGAPPLGSAQRGTQCNPGCRLVKAGETIPMNTPAAVDLCISTDRNTTPNPIYQGGKFPKKFLSKVC